MKHKIDYSKLDEKAFRERVKLLRDLKSQLEKMVKDEMRGSVSARASAAKQLVEIDAELVSASQTKQPAHVKTLREKEREIQRLTLRVVELEARIVELEAALVAGADDASGR